MLCTISQVACSSKHKAMLPHTQSMTKTKADGCASMERNQNLTNCWWGGEAGHSRKHLAALYEVTIWPGNSTMRNPYEGNKNIRIPQNCIWIFIIALLIPGKKVKTSQHAIYTRINKIQFVYTEDYYPAMRTYETPGKAGWLNLELTIFHEKGQIKKVKY